MTRLSPQPPLSRRTLQMQIASELRRPTARMGAERTLTTIFSRRSCFFSDSVSGKHRTYNPLVIRENHFPTIERAIEATGYRRIPETLRDLGRLEDDSVHSLQVARLRSRILGVVLDKCLDDATRDAELDNIVRPACVEDLDWIMAYPEDFHVLRYFQMGDITFTDETMWQEMPSNIRENLQPHTLILGQMPTCILGAPGWMKSYTAAAMIALSNISLAGHGLVEAGAADGVVSLLGIHRGAEMAVLLDRDDHSLKRGNAHARLNQVASHRWFSIQADLTKPEQAIPLIPRLPAQSVLISNIGHWHEYAPMTNAVALRLVSLLESHTHMKAVVLGGYVARCSHHSPERDIKIAHGLGFTAPVHCAQVGTAQAFLLQRPA